jgi:hypothetical protein
MAAGKYRAFKEFSLPRFLQLLAAGEITVGAALLTPVDPTVVAGRGTDGRPALGGL